MLLCIKDWDDDDDNDDDNDDNNNDGNDGKNANNSGAHIGAPLRNWMVLIKSGEHGGSPLRKSMVLINGPGMLNPVSIPISIPVGAGPRVCPHCVHCACRPSNRFVCRQLKLTELKVLKAIMAMERWNHRFMIGDNVDQFTFWILCNRDAEDNANDTGAHIGAPLRDGMALINGPGMLNPVSISISIPIPVGAGPRVCPYCARVCPHCVCLCRQLKLTELTGLMELTVLKAVMAMERWNHRFMIGDNVDQFTCWILCNRNAEDNADDTGAHMGAPLRDWMVLIKSGEHGGSPLRKSMVLINGPGVLNPISIPIPVGADLCVCPYCVRVCLCRHSACRPSNRFVCRQLKLTELIELTLLKAVKATERWNHRFMIGDNVDQFIC